MTKDWVHGAGHFPFCQILSQIVVKAVITSSDFPFFNDCTAASTSLRMVGWSPSVSIWGQFITDGSPLAL